MIEITVLFISTS